MWKLIGLLKRPEGLGMDEFKTWWLEEHAAKVKKWPGLVKYHINLSTTEDQDFDGMAEVWFESREAMDGVFSTKEGQIARESATLGSARLVILLAEEHVMISG